MIPKKPALAKAEVADFSDKIMRKINESSLGTLTLVIARLDRAIQ